MWKESYRIGVQLIDEQHMALFDMVEDLMKTLEEKTPWDGKRKRCMDAIAFMKNYVVMHFKAEEGYQQSIHYSELEQHKKLHIKFTNDVLEYERRLAESRYDARTVKQFLGMLTAWLIYHVADADQKFAEEGRTHVVQKPDDTVKERTLVQCLIKSVSDTLDSMVNLKPGELNGSLVDSGTSVGDIYVTIGVVGDVTGNIVYGFTKEFAFEMLRIMMMREQTQVDELVCSAMAEVANIISGKTTIAIAEKGYPCDITTPEVVVDKNYVVPGEEKARILIRSKIGDMTLTTTFMA